MPECGAGVNTFIALDAHCRTCHKVGMETREQLMEQVRKRTFAARMSLYALCKEAGVSGTVITRWIKSANTPSLKTIGKLERQLDIIEQERAV